MLILQDLKLDISNITITIKEFVNECGITKYKIDTSLSITNDDDDVTPLEYYNKNKNVIDTLLYNKALEYLKNKDTNIEYEYSMEYYTLNGHNFYVGLYLNIDIEYITHKDIDSNAKILVTDYFRENNNFVFKIIQGNPTKEFITELLAYYGFNKDNYTDYTITNGIIDPFYE